VKRLFVGNRTTIAGTVYGTIVVLSSITAGEDYYGRDLWHLEELVITAVLVLWLAHVYSHGIGQSLDTGHRLTMREFGVIARHEFSIPLAAVLPLLAIALGAFGLISHRSALRLALALGVGTLAAQGVRYAQLEHLGRLGTVLTVVLDVALGLAIVALKAWVIH
jgi:hypothetical protein